MKLERNNPDSGGYGKYALIKVRKLKALAGNANASEPWTPEVARALKTLEDLGVLEWGQVGSENEFFTIMLKDRFAEAPMATYAREAASVDEEYAREVAEMALRAGRNSPFCKLPD